MIAKLLDLKVKKEKSGGDQKRSQFICGLKIKANGLTFRVVVDGFSQKDEAEEFARKQQENPTAVIKNVNYSLLDCRVIRKDAESSIWSHLIVCNYKEVA